VHSLCKSRDTTAPGALRSLRGERSSGGRRRPQAHRHVPLFVGRVRRVAPPPRRGV